MSYVSKEELARLPRLNGVPYARKTSDVFEVPNGVGFREDEWRYSAGQCHALAMAILAECPGWRLVAYEVMEWDEGVRIPRHILVSPDGSNTIDIEGWGVWDEDHEEWSWDELKRLVETQDYAVPVLDQKTRRLANRLIAEWRR